MRGPGSGGATPVRRRSVDSPLRSRLGRTREPVGDRPSPRVRGPGPCPFLLGGVPCRAVGLRGTLPAPTAMPRIPVDEVERLMAARPDATLEAALGVFEVFASGSLVGEVYVLDDVSGKRIAIAPTALKDKFRRG